MILTLGQSLLTQNIVGHTFSPSSIPELIYWFDFGFTQSLSLNGSNITSIKNRGSRNTQAMSTTGASSGNAREPLLSTDTIGNAAYGVANFDSSNTEAMQLVSTSDLSTAIKDSWSDNYTVWAVVDVAGSGSNRGIWSGRNPNRFTTFFLNDDTQVTNLVFHDSGSTSEGIAPSDLNDRAILVGVVNKANETMETFFNNQTNGAKDLTGKTLVSSDTNVYIGKGNTSGAYMEGKIFECGIYDVALSTAQRQNLQNYAASKYQITLS